MHDDAGARHYIEAERLLAQATANPARIGVAVVLARALVHAVLSLSPRPDTRPLPWHVTVA